MDEAERLARLLNAKEKGIRAEAARSLGALGEPALPVLIVALQNPDWVVRYRAVEALGRIPGSRIDDLLIHALDDPRDHVRYMAAKVLGNRRVSRSATYLELRLKDENEYVRKSVARALGEIAVPTSRPALESALRTEFSEGVRQALHTALIALQESEYRP